CSRRTRRSSARTARTASHTSTSSTTSTSTCRDRAPSALAIQSGTESGSPQARAYRVKKTLRSAVVQCDSHQGGGTGRPGGMKQQAAAIAFDDWLAGAEDVTYQVLVDSIPDYAIFLLDAEGRVRTWTAAAERIKGYAPREVIGRHFSLFYPQEALDRR